MRPKNSEVLVVITDMKPLEAAQHEDVPSTSDRLSGKSMEDWQRDRRLSIENTHTHTGWGWGGADQSSVAVAPANSPQVNSRDSLTKQTSPPSCLLLPVSCRYFLLLPATSCSPHVWSLQRQSHLTLKPFFLQLTKKHFTKRLHSRRRWKAQCCSDRWL